MRFSPRPAAVTEFDPIHERSLIAEELLRSAARLISGRGELQIIEGVCESLVRVAPHIRLAWTWFGANQAREITPQVCVGPAAGYARQLVIERNLLTQIGPAFRVLDGKTTEAFSISQFSLFGPWRQAAREHGIRHVLALPIGSRFADYGGIFVLYADLEDYFDRVGVSLFSALAELFGSVLGVAAERAELQRTAYHDALTGLLNRHAVNLVELRLQRRSLFDPPASLLMLDLDRFKRINDEFGHGVGDQVLQRTAEAVRKAVRRDDQVVRWGGEEFLVCLPGTALSDAMIVAEKIRASVQAMDEPVPLSVSVGVAEIQPMQHFTDAVARADRALLLAKAQGRNQVCVAGQPEG